MQEMVIDARQYTTIKIKIGDGKTEYITVEVYKHDLTVFPIGEPLKITVCYEKTDEFKPQIERLIH